MKFEVGAHVHFGTEDRLLCSVVTAVDGDDVTCQQFDRPENEHCPVLAEWMR